MSNGGKRVEFNVRERIVSADHDRLQDMVGQARAVQLARSHADQYNVRTPGYAAQISAGGQTPMLADVYGGLFVKVDNASSLFVDPGVVGVIDPDGAPGPDDDPYKLVDDPGMALAGILPWLGNVSGSRRIDVVVADVANQVLETDTRDVFDTATGLFTPMLLNKVTAKRLVYSILRGTPGAGLPALTNTIPLAVASVPSGTASWADVTFWDVRPLVADRITYYKRQNERRRYYDFDFYADVSADHFGFAYTEWNGYLVGGRLMTSVPGLGDVVFDADAPANATANDNFNGLISPPDDLGANPVFLLFPGGLPRWARYSEGAAPGLAIRAPYGTTGLLVAGRARVGFEDYNKVDVNGLASAVQIPPSTGLTGTADGVLLYMLHVQNTVAGDRSPVRSLGTGRWILFSQEEGPSSEIRVEDTLTGTWAAQANFIFHNVQTEWWDAGKIACPRNARRVKLRWDPPPITTTVGSPPPLVDYARIGFYVQQEAMQWGGSWSHRALGDGTVLPVDLISYAGPEVEVPIQHEQSPVRLECGIDVPSTGPMPAAASLWKFDGTGTSIVLLLGYEL
jgi:hypothetical protein